MCDKRACVGVLKAVTCRVGGIVEERPACGRQADREGDITLTQLMLSW
jgi:hypothetical protein